MISGVIYGARSMSSPLVSPNSTCCAEDMTFLGFACVYDKIGLFAERDWVKVTAVVEKEYFADYEGEGPVLHATSVTKAKQPKEPVISFV